jgi:hypothetical protein
MRSRRLRERVVSHGGTGDVNRAAVNRHAEEALRRELKPGEHVAASAAVTSNPSRWGAAAFLALALAMAAAGLAILFGPQPGALTGGPVIGLALPVLALGIQFLPRPMYVAVTGQRVICCRLSRLRSAPRRLAFAVPLADLRIVKYRSGTYGGSMRCEVPGHKRIRLDASRAGRKEFAGVGMALARSGAFTKLDPPYPSIVNS